jgi:hypothetical protein
MTERRIYSALVTEADNDLYGQQFPYSNENHRFNAMISDLCEAYMGEHEILWICLSDSATFL